MAKARRPKPKVQSPTLPPRVRIGEEAGLRKKRKITSKNKDGQKLSAIPSFSGKPNEPYLPLPERLKRPEVAPLRVMESNFEKNLSKPRVSVVLADQDGVDRLWHCLFSLKTQTYPVFETVFVDNHSEDSSISFVRSNYPQTRILECQEDFGLVMGYQLGATCATGDLVVLLSTRMVVTPDWLEKLTKNFAKNWPSAGILCVYPPSEQRGEGIAEPVFRKSSTLNFLGYPMDGFFSEPNRVFCPTMDAVAYPRFLAPEGPFDPDYISRQQGTCWGWKVRLSGREVVGCSEARMFKGSEEGLEESNVLDWHDHYLDIRNRWTNLFVFYERRNLVRIFPWIVLDAVWTLLKSFVTSFHLLWGVLFAIGWIISHAGSIERKREEVQGRRKVNDDGIIGVLSGRIAQDDGPFSRVINFLSLAYCRLTGLKVLEWVSGPKPIRRPKH